MKAFILALLAVVIAFLVLLRFPPGDAFEAGLLAFIASAYTLGWVQMLIFRRHWPARSLGIFWTLVADSCFWWGTLAGYWFHWHQAWLVALIVAAFLCGGPLYFGGITVYIVSRRRKAS